LVSLGIITLIATVVLSNQSKYTEGTHLTNQADEIGLQLSQAQIYGISVREFSPGSEEFDVSYGLSFNISSTGSNDAYIYFADRDSDNRYDSGWACPTDSNSECISKMFLTKGNTIAVDGLCYVRTNNREQCNLGRIDISFLRPKTEAIIQVFNVAGNYMDPQPDNIVGAKINLISPNGLPRSIVVYKSGQISVQ